MSADAQSLATSEQAEAASVNGHLTDQAAQEAAHEKVGDFIRGHDAGWKSCEEHMKAHLLRAPLPQNATEPMQRAMQHAALLRKSMNDVWRAALSEAGLIDVGSP